MPKSTSTLEWCIVRLGDDVNWWVEEVSDTIHWDTDGLSIIDPRQVDHIIELIDPLRDYGFSPDVMERAFILFRIDKDLGQNRVRLVRVKDSILESEEKLFALPDIVDDENSAYADFIDHVTRARVKLLNDLFEFEQRLTVDEVEEIIREEANADFMAGKAAHLYTEITAVLDFMPAGVEGDEDEDSPRAKKAADDDEEFPEVEEDDEALKDDDSLRWDDDEDEEEEEDGEGKKKAKDGDEEDEDEKEEASEDEGDAPRSRRRR